MVPASPLSKDDMDAINAWRLLGNGMGGIDWSGMPWAIEFLEVTDVLGLITRLHAIKMRGATDGSSKCPSQP